MSSDPAQGESTIMLASTPVAGAATATGAGDGAVALPTTAAPWARLTLPRVRVVPGPLAGGIALASLILGTLVLVAFATSGPTVLVARSTLAFPGWEAGPLHWLSHGLPNGLMTLSYGLSGLMIVMLVAYGVVLASIRTLPMRVIVICVVAVHAIMLLSPPLQLTDLFNYLGYARLGGLHGVNPYTHVIAYELRDPVYLFASWHNLHSPYGPLFTAATYLLPIGSLSLSYWILKVATILASLAFLGLLCKCARQLGRDPRLVLAFVAFNPIYVVYAVGGFHNDFFMLVPSTASIALLLARRDRSAGAMLMLAVAIKFSAVLLLPFLVVAVRPSRRRMRQILEGAALAAIPLAALSIALFGFSIPNLQDQSTLLTNFSIPNVVGLLVGLGGGTPLLLRVADVALVIAVVMLLRRRGDWLTRAGWATFALIASLAWLVPWYVIWLLPLAALGTSVRLRRAAIAMTVFLVVAFVPATEIYLAQHGEDPLGKAVQATRQLQLKLER